MIVYTLLYGLSSIHHKNYYCGYLGFPIFGVLSEIIESGFQRILLLFLSKIREIARLLLFSYYYEVVMKAISS
jgi:hypothetical protein